MECLRSNPKKSVIYIQFSLQENQRNKICRFSCCKLEIGLRWNQIINSSPKLTSFLHLETKMYLKWIKEEWNPWCKTHTLTCNTGVELFPPTYKTRKLNKIHETTDNRWWTKGIALDCELREKENKWGEHYDASSFRPGIACQTKIYKVHRHCILD